VAAYRGPAAAGRLGTVRRDTSVCVTQILIIALILALGALVFGGTYVLVELRSRLDQPATRRRVGDDPMRTRSTRGGKLTGPAHPRGWVQGEDLMAFPRRLHGLEQQLSQGLADTNAQAQHLRGLQADVAAKNQRDELVGRYADDIRLLERRAAGMARVLGLVWRTRAILALRAHTAVTARRRPGIDGLPVGAIDARDLDAAAITYAAAASLVRSYVVDVRHRATQIEDLIPASPAAMAIDAEGEKTVAEERDQAVATHERLHAEMDLLADKLNYLAERCRTRKVVEGAAVGIDEHGGGGAVFDEVNRALAGLSELSRIGDQQLADTALDDLESGITRLERAGLEVQAEADAAREVAKLLEGFEGA
jgi:hypothetical protein